MTPTITKPLQQRLIYRTPEELNDWFNKQLLPFLGQVRQAANYVGTNQQSTQTAATGTFATIWSSADVAAGQSVLIDATIMAVDTTVTSTAVFKITGTFFNAGVLLQEGLTVAGYTQNSPGFAVQFLVVANHVEVQVQDDGALTVNWQATVGTQEIGP